MPSPIIARADALMHRRRQSDVETDDIPVLTDAVDNDDDIPVLTETDPLPEPEATPELVAAANELPADPPPQEPPAPAPTIDPELRDLLVHELSRRIEDRIKAALPQIIRSTVTDFLAEQEMIANN